MHTSPGHCATSDMIVLHIHGYNMVALVIMSGYHSLVYSPVPHFSQRQMVSSDEHARGEARLTTLPMSSMASCSRVFVECCPDNEIIQLEGWSRMSEFWEEDPTQFATFLDGSRRFIYLSTRTQNV